MADQLLEQVRDIAEGQIDFEGQRLAEMGATALLTTAGVSTISHSPNTVLSLHINIL